MKFSPAVMNSPKRFYQQFVDFEEQAAAIYFRLASRFSPEIPELGALWLEMGIHEKEHADLLQFCIAEELFAEKLPTDAEIQQTAGLLSSLLERASDPNLSIPEAFRIAIRIETSEVSAVYDRITTPLHSSAYLLRRKVAASLPHHISYLYKEARKFTLPEDIFKDLEQARQSSR
jgi:hypothetical protein